MSERGREGGRERERAKESERVDMNKKGDDDPCNIRKANSRNGSRRSEHVH